MKPVVEHIALREWERLTPETCGLLKGRFFSGSESTVADRLTSTGLVGLTELRDGLTIEANSNVGRLRIGDLDITIRPKIDQSTLMNLLRYAYGFRNLRLLDESTQKLEQAGFEDLLVRQLVDEVTELVSRGLNRQYVPTAEYLSAPRGRIDFARIAKDGGLIAASLPCVHHPRSQDTLLNRVLLAGLELAARVTSDVGLRRESNRVASLLCDEVADIPLSWEVFDRLERNMNRLAVAYEPAVKLIRLIWECQGVSFAGQESAVALPGFLFDMNRFFQALLARFLTSNLQKYSVREEHRLSGMMRYTAGYNPKCLKAPTPRPDFVVLCDGKSVAVLDAKYRDLWEHKLGRDMLYQLALYAAVQSNRVATILYPSTELNAKESRIDICDPVLRTQVAQVRLRPVNLALLEALVLGKPTVMLERQRVQYAMSLAFGSD